MQMTTLTNITHGCHSETSGLTFPLDSDPLVEGSLLCEDCDGAGLTGRVVVDTGQFSVEGQHFIDHVTEQLVIVHELWQVTGQLLHHQYYQPTTKLCL